MDRNWTRIWASSGEQLGKIWFALFKVSVNIIEIEYTEREIKTFICSGAQSICCQSWHEGSLRTNIIVFNMQ